MKVIIGAEVVSKASLVSALVFVELLLKSVVNESCKDFVEKWYYCDWPVILWKVGIARFVHYCDR